MACDMSASILHKKLRNFVGHTFSYLSDEWLLIDVLISEDSVILQRKQHQSNHQLQTDQFGHARRRVPETLSIAISDDEGVGYSEELLLLLQGKQN